MWKFASLKQPQKRDPLELSTSLKTLLKRPWQEQYATKEGIGLKEFGRLAHDGLLLEGKLEEYEQAFNGVDLEEKGVISKDGAMEISSP